MGNCSFKSSVVVSADETAKGFNQFIRVMTDSGEILKLKGPKLAGEILHDFPGHKICGKGHVSSPLLDHQELLVGHVYYLLPITNPTAAKDRSGDQEDGNGGKNDCQMEDMEPVRKSTSAEAAMEMAASLANGPALEVLPPPQKGVWKVKLAITPKQLEEILSEEVNTEALIEQMSMAANNAVSSGSVTPRRSKISWGLILKQRVLGNVFKAHNSHIEQDNEVQAVNLFKNNPIYEC
ncbi:OLC1v1030077C1 [Oldenlandia corymbosa var. corymbosa]|uniref:OLC1v1030077C1 n=1 Tax=Oldenlandia corymbosa var. corymbosa TaxID=529605 RepID=A0AAV1CIN8_OLDCO|nr:OLC1v1030077C1 [Oldenlandia corymbosa var. corymbosa]